LTSVLRLLVASLAVNLAVLASLGPIVLFFSLSTKSYAFIQLLNVVMFSLAGVLGLIFLLQTLHRLTSTNVRRVLLPGEENVTRQLSEENPYSESTSLAKSGDAGEVGGCDVTSALDMPSGQALGRHTRLVFSCWVIVFALVGAQMGWVLRPFIGNPAQEFDWFRERKSNFFEAVLNAIGTLFTGGG
jgi:hypothetical protein